jgi:hypothetical protein
MIQRRRCWQRSLKNKKVITPESHLGLPVALRLVLVKQAEQLQRCIEEKQAQPKAKWYLVQFFLKDKNFKDKKLRGAIKGIGISFAIFGSIPTAIKHFISNVPKLQKKLDLSNTKYQIYYDRPDF